MAQVINDVDNIGNLSKDKDTLKLYSDLDDFDSQRECNSNDELQDGFMNLKRIHEHTSVEKLDTQTPVIVKLSNILVNGHLPNDELMSNNDSKDDSPLDKVDLPPSDVNSLNSTILNNDISLNSVCKQSSNCSVGLRSLRNSDDAEVLNLTKHDVNDQFSGNTYQTESGLSITMVPDNPSSASEQNDDICEKDSMTSTCDNTVNDVVTSNKSKKGSDKKESPSVTVAPRRSSRNLNKQKKYIDDDIVEVAPTDPLADNSKPKSCNKTILVSGTKGLVEFASNARTSEFINKKEPTLVIIDTKSILSGHGPVPVSHSSSYSHLIRSLNSTTTIPMPSTISNVSSLNRGTPCSTPAFTVTPVSFPQYRNIPPQMKPIILGPPSATVKTEHLSNISTSAAFTTAPVHVKQAQLVLPSLTDDMFVVEAPSFIVPYVYEKPPMRALKEQINELKTVINESEREVAEKSGQVRDSEKTVIETDSKKCDTKEKMDVEQDSQKLSKVKEDEITAPETGSEKPNDSIDVKVETINLKSVVESLEKLNDEKKVEDAPRKPVSYFESPLGKFFINIGLNLVQEHVQTDLLRSQKRKRIKEGSERSAEIKATIAELTKTLECSKENNDSFRMEMKKCGLCDFATDSSLALAHHLETPHIKNFTYRCNFCPFEVRSPHDILHHLEVEHNVRGRLERAPSLHQCPNCPFEENQKSKLTRHSISCIKKYRPEKNQDPPLDWEPPAKIPRVTRNQPPSMNHTNNTMYHASMAGFKHTSQNSLLPKLIPNLNTLKSHIVTNVNIKPGTTGAAFVNRLQNNNPQTNFNQRSISVQNFSQGVLLQNASSNMQAQVMLPEGLQLTDKLPIYQNRNTKQNSLNMNASTKLLNPSISITPLQRPNSSLQQSKSGEISENTIASLNTSAKPSTNPVEKDTLVICEICDGYIKNLDGLRNHMQWIHKVKIHPKMIYNRPPLNCQKCQSRFFTDQGLERHLLGTHGLVTSSMQEAANKSKDGGRCPICGRVYQWKLLNHVARDHQMALKPAHLSYKCTVCTATFGMYKQFEGHVYSAHSLVAKRAVDVKKPVLSTTFTSQRQTLLKPLRINDEITIIPQPMKSSKTINKPSNNNPMVGVNSKSRG